MTINPNEVVVMTQIMAVNGDVPANVGGWRLSEGYAGSVQRRNGVVGEVAYDGDAAYVCVSGCTQLALPNTHPDYKPCPATLWVSVPRPGSIDWRCVPEVYHDREGWRVRSAVNA